MNLTLLTDCIFNVTGEKGHNVTWCHNTTISGEMALMYLSPSATVIALLCLSVNVVISLILNPLLMLILQGSPSLKTPPNSHLLNICLNNILLCVSMIIAIVGLNVNSVNVTSNDTAHILSGIQIFLVYNALLQYWGTFACIGYYRQKTIKQPGLTVRTRRHLVSRSIAGNWIVSLILSITCSLSFADSCVFVQSTLDPFRKDYFFRRIRDFSVEQLTVIIFIYGVFVIGLVTICWSYYGIFKTLNVTGTFAKNRVRPWQRAPSLTSDVADLTIPGGRSYYPDSTMGRPFTISQKASDTLVVHYQKYDHSLAFADILALENPILAASIQNQQQKRPVQQTLSNGSNHSGKLRCPDFTDISLGADLERLQKLKNSSALRNQFLRRDRVSLSSATKNSLVMFCAYLTCSLPLIICSFPRALVAVPAEHRVTTLLICRLLFFLNAPVYPTWYLLFSKRVRKCLRRMCDIILLRVHVRR